MPENETGLIELLRKPLEQITETTTTGPVGKLIIAALAANRERFNGLGPAALCRIINSAKMGLKISAESAKTYAKKAGIKVVSKPRGGARESTHPKRIP